MRKIFKLATVFFTAIFLASCTGVGNSSIGYKQITMAEAVKIMEEENGYIILDVRRPDEYAEGHIPNAVNIDVLEPAFAERIATLDRERTVALYCRSGRRSKAAAEQVSKLGYKVVELDGGILSWRGKLVR